MGLRFFKRGSKYQGVSDALHSIRQEFEAIWSKIDNYVAPEDSVSSEQQNYIPQISYAGRSEDYEYNRDFKLILTQVVGGWQVRVVDGATYNPLTESSDSSLAYVNGDSYNVSPVRFGVLNANTTFALRFSTPFDANGNVVREPTLEVIDLAAMGMTEMPANDIQYAWYRIGRFKVDDGIGRVIQDHTDGPVDMKWYYRCEL